MWRVVTPEYMPAVICGSGIGAAGTERRQRQSQGWHVRWGQDDDGGLPATVEQYAETCGA